MRSEEVVARVRWGNRRFWRINEFTDLASAQAFASQLAERAVDAEPIEVRVEVRSETGWSPAR